jgi:hypothetical protein
LSVTTEYCFFAIPGSETFKAANTVSDVPSPVPVSFKMGHQSDHSFLLGVRYHFGVGAAPAPAPAPMAAPAPAPARSYLVFFDWDKATLTPRAQQIIAEAAANSTKVTYTQIQVNGYTDTSGRLHRYLGHAAVLSGTVDPPRASGRRRTGQGRRAEGRSCDPGLWRDASAGADRAGRSRAAEPPH